MAAAATVRIGDHDLKVVPRVARDGMSGSPMVWDPVEMSLLALAGCRKCWGEGVRYGRRRFGGPYP